jgi:hypothetical protein
MLRAVAPLEPPLAAMMIRSVPLSKVSKFGLHETYNRKRHPYEYVNAQQRASFMSLPPVPHNGDRAREIAVQKWSL